MRELSAEQGAPAPGTDWSAARFAPDATLVRLPQWRMLPDGHGEMLHEKSGVWKRIHPIYVAALEAIRDGATFEVAYTRALEVRGDELRPNHVRAYLRRFYWTLHESGYIHIPLEEPPDVFRGRYRRKKELGRGGVGVAHLCHDEREGRHVVVKHAWGYLQMPDRADRGVRREGEVMKRLDHPGVARFFDEFEERGLYHLVREFADGTPLGEAWRKDGARSADERKRMGIEMADIIAHVHERGFLFLDITPGNFILLADGRPQVIDVGICRPHQHGVVAITAPMGSRGYASPEVIDRVEATFRSDVFGFGCVYHSFLTGHTPGHRWRDEERRAALEKAGAPADERELVLACCAHDPAARPADMREVIGRLESLA